MLSLFVRNIYRHSRQVLTEVTGDYYWLDTITIAFRVTEKVSFW
jgi:hypothetical protein